MRSLLCASLERRARALLGGWATGRGARDDGVSVVVARGEGAPGAWRARQGAVRGRAACQGRRLSDSRVARAAGGGSASCTPPLQAVHQPERSRRSRRRLLLCVTPCEPRTLPATHGKSGRAAGIASGPEIAEGHLVGHQALSRPRSDGGRAAASAVSHACAWSPNGKLAAPHKPPLPRRSEATAAAAGGSAPSADPTGRQSTSGDADPRRDWLWQVVCGCGTPACL